MGWFQFSLVQDETDLLKVVQKLSLSSQDEKIHVEIALLLALQNISIDQFFFAIIAYKSICFHVI